MIRNLVFDMGNVLLEYRTARTLARYFSGDEDRTLIDRELFNGPEWVQADLGNCTEEGLFQGVSRRVPQRLHAALQDCIHGWHADMIPMPQSQRFVAEMKEKGYGLYVLSNASPLFYEYFPHFGDIGVFDGMVVSCDYHVIKPDERIYRILLKKFRLKPEECLFFDDRPENVLGARKAGMNSEVFSGDWENLRRTYQL
ncbi:MAG: HAD family hydrolase [Candidatus Heritagella sp.]